MLQAVSVPGPYFFRSYFKSGSGSSSIRQIRVLDGKGFISTGSSEPGDREITWISRKQSVTPLTKPSMSSQVPPGNPKPISDPKLRSIATEWARKLKDGDSVHLQSFTDAGNRMAVASFKFLKNGFPPIDPRYGITFTLSLPDGAFLGLFRNRSIASKQIGVVRYKTANEATQVFRAIHPTTRYIVPDDIGYAPMHKGMAGAVLRGDMQPLNPATVILESVPTIGYSASPKDPEFHVVWQFRFHPKPMAGHVVHGTFSVLMDASSGQLVGEVTRA